LSAFHILENAANYCSPENTQAMKQTLPFLMAATIAALFVGCAEEKQVQMNLTDVQLVKIDTIQRYPENTQKLLTWRDENHIDYVTFVPLETYYPLGARMKVMVKR
jgi:hypothetical protein